MDYYSVIIAPIVTEKASWIASTKPNTKKYVLKIDLKANKEIVKQCLYKLYGVDVVKVNVIVKQGKKKKFRSSNVTLPKYKKAIVTLAARQSLDLNRLT